MCGTVLGRLYLITDRRAAGHRDLETVLDAALGALPPGAALVQLRERDLSARELITLARRLHAITAAHACPLLINDRLDVALAAGADGVHLPEAGLDIAVARVLAGPDLLIGVSTHSAEGAARAARDGADIIVCGPVWPTPSKAGMGEPLGLDALAAAVRAVQDTTDAASFVAAGRRPHLYALGGIDTLERARQARYAGVHGVAAIRAFFAAPDPAAAARAFRFAVEPLQ